MPPRDKTKKPVFIFKVDTGEYQELKNIEFADISAESLHEEITREMDRLAFIANMSYGQYLACYALSIPNNWMRMNGFRTIRQRAIWRLMRKNAKQRYRELWDMYS